MIFNPQIIKKIEKAQLIGRGCNNFSTAKKWQMVRDAKTSGDKFVICNVSESEPRVFKDRYILERWPERVVDGIKLAIKTMGAKKGFIYLNPEYYEQFQDYLNAIIHPECSGENLNIELYQKPLHDYVGGEETAVLNSMQGLRVEPRLKPPFPTTNGFFDQPTLVNNCETFYAVSLINSGEYKNTRFYCLSGDDVRGEQVKELSTSITVKKAIDAFDHQPSEKYFYQIGGGAAGSCYNYKQLNRKFNGLASVVIYRADRSEKDVVMKWLDFFKNESCGQCVPCREGTYRLRNMMEEYFVDNSSLNRDVFEDLIFSLQNTSLCPLGKLSANAMLSYYRNVKGRKLFEGMGEKCDI